MSDHDRQIANGANGATGGNDAIDGIRVIGANGGNNDQLANAQRHQHRQQDGQLLTHGQNPNAAPQQQQPPAQVPIVAQPPTMAGLVHVIRHEIANQNPAPTPRQLIHADVHNRPPPNSPNALQRDRAASLRSLNEQMQNMNIGTRPRPGLGLRTEPTPPTYIPAAEQALRFHKQDVLANQTTSGFLGKIAEFMNYTLQVNPDMPPQAIELTREILEESRHSNQQANLKLEGLNRASRVVSYYETPIEKPTYTDRDFDDRYVEPHFNLREILMVAGYFDPNDKEADFKHTWQKLLDYGTNNRFMEHHYLQALSAMLRKEAYETFNEFRTTGRTLDEILEYFAKVYTKKRSLIADRHAVDKFTRKKGESILVCMDRCIIAIDKLRHLYPSRGWPDMRQQMRRNILMQVIKEETKRHIQMEEDDITESTGMPYDFDKLIRLADRYERHHNAAPKDELSTIFKVASGGLHTRPPNVDKSVDQLAFLKKEQMLEKRLDTLQAKIEELHSNNTRVYKNDNRTDKARESRRRDRSDSQRRARDISHDRNRDLSSDDKTNKPNDSTPTPASSSSSSYPPKPPFQPRNPYDRNRSRSPGPPRSRSPPRRSVTPVTPSHITYSRNNSRNRSSSQNNRDRSRSRSQTRYNPRSNSENRTDTVTTHGHKAVYITINGQSYVAQPQKKSEN